MLIPLCGRSIPAVCRRMLSAKNNCRDPSPAGKHGGLRMTHDPKFEIRDEFFFLRSRISNQQSRSSRQPLIPVLLNSAFLRSSFAIQNSSFPSPFSPLDSWPRKTYT